MALIKKGKKYYGSEQADIRPELVRYSQANGYPVQHFADAKCTCAATVFRLCLDDDEGAAVRTCCSCNMEHPMGDSAEFLEDAELGECECPCGGGVFEITVGVSLYADSDDVRWLYLGCRCPACGLVAVYGDWKNELHGYRELLAKV
jgi:hypothetical protein